MKIEDTQIYKSFITYIAKSIDNDIRELCIKAGINSRLSNEKMKNYLKNNNLSVAFRKLITKKDNQYKVRGVYILYNTKTKHQLKCLVKTIKE